MIGVAAVTAPTLIRLAVQGSVSMAVFLTYIPFVLIVALLLRPWAAAVVAVACAIIADLLFMAPFLALAPTADDVFSVAAFLITSAVIIVFMRSVRRSLEVCIAPGPAASRNIIFSEKQGEAWVSWRSERPPVKLGSHIEVAEMMEDYIAQVELGERLTKKPKPH